MAFDKEELKQLGELFDNQHSLIVTDVKVLLEQELRPIRDDLDWMKKRLDQLFKMVSEDIAVAYKEIESLKRTIKNLEKRVVALEHR